MRHICTHIMWLYIFLKLNYYPPLQVIIHIYKYKQNVCAHYDWFKTKFKILPIMTLIGSAIIIRCNQSKHGEDGDRPRKIYFIISGVLCYKSCSMILPAVFITETMQLISRLCFTQHFGFLKIEIRWQFAFALCNFLLLGKTL